MSIDVRRLTLLRGRDQIVEPGKTVVFVEIAEMGPVPRIRNSAAQHPGAAVIVRVIGDSHTVRPREFWCADWPDPLPPGFGYAVVDTEAA